MMNIKIETKNGKKVNLPIRTNFKNGILCKIPEGSKILELNTATICGDAFDVGEKSSI